MESTTLNVRQLDTEINDFKGNNKEDQRTGNRIVRGIDSDKMAETIEKVGPEVGGPSNLITIEELIRDNKRPAEETVDTKIRRRGGKKLRQSRERAELNRSIRTTLEMLTSTLVCPLDTDKKKFKGNNEKDQRTGNQTVTCTDSDKQPGILEKAAPGVEGPYNPLTKEESINDNKIPAEGVVEKKKRKSGEVDKYD